MNTFTVTNVDDEVIRRLEARAASNHRELEDEVLEKLRTVLAENTD